MIKSNELRIGNWVKITLGVTDELNDGPGYIYRQIDVPDFYKNDFLDPIPLSAEILEKAGFDRLPGSTFVYRIFVKDFEISVSTELHYVYIDTQWGQASIKHPIVKYLHQLQNLYFALTGEELPVEL